MDTTNKKLTDATKFPTLKIKLHYNCERCSNSIGYDPYIEAKMLSIDNLYYSVYINNY